MSKSKYPILAVCMLALGLLVAGCSQGNSAQDAQARVDAAKAELQNAQADLKAEQQQPGESDAVKEANVKLKTAQANLRAERAKSARSQPAPQKAAPVCGDCGEISAITQLKTAGSRTSTGAIVGSVLGAVAGVAIGNQIGHGGGKTAAKVVGGLGGAAAGNEIGKRIDKDTYFAVTVNMDAGGSRTINVPSDAGLAVGQSVRVRNGNIVLQ